MRFVLLAGLVGLLAACEVAPVDLPRPDPIVQRDAPSPQLRQQAERAARMFTQVVDDVEPVAEAECRARTRRTNCDFLIVVDDRPGQPPNAFQTVDRGGRRL